MGRHVRVHDEGGQRLVARCVNFVSNDKENI
jgi:hypothetical protein